MLDDLKLFILAAQSGSLTLAADAQDTTVATLSRRLSALETHLGCKLLNRSPRGLTLTAEGQMYFEECADYIQSLDLRLDNLNRALTSLEGPLKVLAPTNLASGPLDLFWQQFLNAQPQIELTVELNNRMLDLKATQADIAIRIGPQQNSDLIQKPLGYVPSLLVAAPQSNLPGTLEQLRQADTVATHLLNKWLLTDTDGNTHSVVKSHRHMSNDLGMLVNLLKGSGGVALCPLSMVQPMLESGELVQVMPGWFGPRRDVFAIWPHRRNLNARGRLFIDHLNAFLLKQAWFQPLEL